MWRDSFCGAARGRCAATRRRFCAGDPRMIDAEIIAGDSALGDTRLSRTCSPLSSPPSRGPSVRDPSFFLSRLGISFGRGDPEGSRGRRNAGENTRGSARKPINPAPSRRRGRARSIDSCSGNYGRGCFDANGISRACLHLIRGDLTSSESIGGIGLFAIELRF